MTIILYIILGITILATIIAAHLHKWNMFTAAIVAFIVYGIIILIIT